MSKNDEVTGPSSSKNFAQLNYLSLQEVVTREGFDFLDFGCSKGGSLELGRSLLGGVKGLGIDIDPAKVQVTTDLGYKALVADATDLKLEVGSVSFVCLRRFLEHLPGYTHGKKSLDSAISAARDFVYICHPWFDADAPLMDLGLKPYWSDWRGHRTHFGKFQFYNALNGNARVHRWWLFGNTRVTSNKSKEIISLAAPRDSNGASQADIDARTKISFDFPVYREIVCLIQINPQFDIQELIRKLNSQAELAVEFDSAKQISVKDVPVRALDFRMSNISVSTGTDDKQKYTRILKNVPDKCGSYAVGDGVTVHILEETRKSTAAEPLSAVSDEQRPSLRWTSGPVFVAEVKSGYCDTKTGFIFTSQKVPIRESFVTMQSLQQYIDTDLDFAFDTATKKHDSTLFVAMNPRAQNYAHWVQDTISKPLIYETLYSSKSTPYGEGKLLFSYPTCEFQSEYMSLFANSSQSTNASNYLHGNFVFSSGVTVGSGHNISPILGRMKDYIMNKSPISTYERGGKRIRAYISRSKAKMRRIMNEDDILPLLRDFGFVPIILEELSVRQQIEIFNRSDIVFSAHGAGLANMLYCKDGGLLIEAFPKNGFHISAFWRYASIRKCSYAYVSGRVVREDKNPANSDFVLDVSDLKVLLRECGL